MNAVLVRSIVSVVGLAVMTASMGFGWFYHQKYQNEAALTKPLKTRSSELEAELAKTKKENEGLWEDRTTLEQQVAALKRLSDTSANPADPGADQDANPALGGADGGQPRDGGDAALLESLRQEVVNLREAQQAAFQSRNELVDEFEKQQALLEAEQEKLRTELTTTREDLKDAVASQAKLEQQLGKLAGDSPDTPDAGKQNVAAAKPGDPGASGPAIGSSTTTLLDDTGWQSLRPGTVLADQPPTLGGSIGTTVPYPSLPSSYPSTYPSAGQGTIIVSPPSYSTPLSPSVPTITSPPVRYYYTPNYYAPSYYWP